MQEIVVAGLRDRECHFEMRPGPDRVAKGTINRSFGQPVQDRVSGEGAHRQTQGGPLIPLVQNAHEVLGHECGRGGADQIHACPRAGRLAGAPARARAMSP